MFATASKKTGRITDARASHLKVLQSAGIEHLTVHGLRRSFSLLAEAAGAPAGAIAQIMGHKPSATAEGYRPRSMDALRPFAQRIEAWFNVLVLWIQTICFVSGTKRLRHGFWNKRESDLMPFSRIDHFSLSCERRRQKICGLQIVVWEKTGFDIAKFGSVG